MYKYNSFYEIYNHQLWKNQALKIEKPKAISFTRLKAIQNPSLNLSFPLGLSRR